MLIDFRSDTVTRPTEGMREAMFRAPVGDDVFGEDPSVNRLEQVAAGIFGMEAALFCPSGTMTNQVAIRCHTQPGDEVICDVTSHIYQYEGGGIAVNSGASVKLISGNHGRITAAQVAEGVNADDVHKPVSRLVSLENTANRGGGTCYELEELQKIRAVCTENKLSLHLDGARLFNALVAKRQEAADYGKLFDSISICLSKGLGSPAGSVLIGTAPFIKKARRIRKVLGGGMRQAGYLAAAGLYALKHHISLLEVDHHHARLIAEALRQKDFIEEILPVETNILIFSVRGRYTPAALVAALKEQDILALAISAHQVRLVLHLDVTEEMVQRTLEVIRAL
ncbi:GntG family PLP-dependent aldolase [Paraflavisolibacter sp. H34]|uniref:threonine aldolase family protein n=1 Tax=Huijunlia imazamoxiresistens TaxID=3127457 RepID=UPI003019472D